ncbi:MAG: DUF4982 domain-containing protein, partial [Ferruginibacter sp.]|nr:DUF4982 domain-containing protein [Ferruginibacter sp.]
MKKYFIILLSLFLLQPSVAQVRSVVNFNAQWKFYLGDDSLASTINFNDALWRKLNVPHDWSIEQQFAPTAKATTQGGALPGGIGWYRKIFTIEPSAKNKNIFIEFDGIYRNSEVWINGHYLGKRPNGYISFRYDITPYVKFDNTQNVIAVKVDNSQQPNSRWYTGSGIYRDVQLVFENRYAAVKQWGAFVTTSNITAKEATVNVNTTLVSSIKGWKSFNLFFDIYDANNKLVSGGEKITNGRLKFSGNKVQHAFSTNIFNPKLWSVQNPYLYKLVIRVVGNGKIIDEYKTTFGIRSFYFDAQKGFFLNNAPLKIKGVCMHHDLGALGSAFNTRAAERQLQILKNMGCNAIRTAHNPPASAFLDLCDKMGFLVMDEAFDMWKKKKNKFDYSQDFDVWHKQDLADMIQRDRNHPSIIMWSIGNEIREQFDSSGISIAKELVDIVKSIDDTRPVTCALTENNPDKNFIYQSQALDILSFNYKQFDYAQLPIRFPNQKFIAAETASALATRGVYDSPSDSMNVWPPDSKMFSGGNKDFTCNAYDNTYAYWGTTHEKAWLAVKQNKFMAGCFVWSGFDFLGEPVPYPTWPARSAYYGIIDLAGFPKDVYYMYQSEWTKKPVLHVFPHWNWTQGQIVDVWAYYNNADEVELFLNGKSLGVRKKKQDELHVKWEVPFEAGVLKAVSKNNNKVVLVKEIKTAGEPYAVELIADRSKIKADGNDLCYITANIVDKQGNIV